MEAWERVEEERFGRILGRDRANLLREKSEFNFLEIKDKVDNILDRVSAIHDNFDFWMELSEIKKRNINNALDDMARQFDSMEQFDPRQGDAWSNRNNIIVNFQNRYNDFYSMVIEPLSAYLGRKAYSQELTSKFGDEAKAELSEIKRVRKEIEKVQIKVNEAASVASNVASAAHATSFAGQAQQHKKSAKTWLFWGGVATVIGGSIVALVIFDIFKELTEKNISGRPEEYVLKVIVLTFTFFGVRFMMKNYSTHQHLYVINQQRANTLQSMEAFQAGASDASSKDAVLLAAVGTAYSHQETGFITTREGAGSGESEITNIIKTITNR